MACIHAAAFPPGEAWSADAIGTQLGLPGTFGWIDPAGGMILARVAADEAEVLTLAVAPAHRGCGCGRALLRHAMQEAGARGALTIVLEVATGNVAARRLYFGAGFIEVGRRPEYYAGGSDAYILRGSLTPCGSTD